MKGKSEAMTASTIESLNFLRGYIQMADDGVQMGWHERNGGNFSYRLTAEDVEQAKPFFHEPGEWAPTQVDVPNLAGEYFLVTGTGKFMRNIVRNPEDSLAIAEIDAQGKNYRLVWGLKNGGRPTSEFPTHLLNQSIKKEINPKYRVLYHAHPINTIALTFVLPLEDKAFTQEIWSMMTECPVIFPEGIGVVPWMPPGGWEIALASAEKIRKYDILVWAHHGVFCSGADFDQTFGLMEAVEKSATISVKVRSMGGKRQTMTVENFRQLAEVFHLDMREEFLE